MCTPALQEFSSLLHLLKFTGMMERMGFFRGTIFAPSNSALLVTLHALDNLLEGNRIELSEEERKQLLALIL